MTTTRDAFEAWFEDLFDDQPLWDAVRNCYIEHSIHMAWKGWQAATLAAQDKRQPLTDDVLLIEFGKLYPNDVGILELAKHNKDYALESIGARHHWTAFKCGARAIENAHGIKA